jgi:exopolysaccharide biosynthesis protein
LRIDLKEPSLRAFLTPDNGDSPLETNGETTSAFLDRNQLSVAINVHFFSPCCEHVDGQPKDLTGLAISDGRLVSPWEERMPDVLLICPGMSVHITDGAPADLSKVRIGIAGRRILRDGSVVGAHRTNAFATSRHPRSALGVSADGRQLILLVIDGRQPEHSVGATLVETAEWLAALGASCGLNVDGGGSTTLVITQSDGTAFVLNKVSGGDQRVVGSNLGFYAAGLDPGSGAD